MNQTKKNFLYNVAYQILILIIPFITLPYISRVLGSEGIGVYSYTYSIVYYFMIFAMLGLNKYGNRKIAQVRDDYKRLSKTFKEIFIMQVISSLLMIFLYFLYLLVFNNDYLVVAIAQSLYIISCLFDINWFYFGIEKFKLTVIRNTIIKILSLILIFTLVKNSNDIIIYTIILGSTTLLSQLVLFPFLKNFINLKEKIKWKDIKLHFKPNLKLFLPVIAIAIYIMMDKTMLGIFSGVSEVGIYENAQKVYTIPLSILTALGTVMLPKMSNMIANSKESEVRNTINKTMEFIMFLAMPMMIGIMLISNDFCVLFFGNDFIKSGKVLIILSFAIPIVTWGDVIRTQYLIPKEMDKEYIISAYFGAIINFIINILLIPKYGALGAAVGTVAAELSVSLYQSLSVRKFLPITTYKIYILKYCFMSLLMGSIVYILTYSINNKIIKIVFEIFIAVCIYCLLNLRYIRKILKHNSL